VGRPWGPRIPVVLWLAACVLAWQIRAADERRLAVEPDDRPLPAAPDSSGEFLFRHHWSEGDGGPAPRIRDQDLSASLAYSDLLHMSSAFGVPEPWTTAAAAKWTRTAEGRTRTDRQAELVRRAAARGVTLTVDRHGISSRPDYHWIVDQSRDDMKTIALRLADLFERGRIDRKRGLHRMVASFVQSIPYAIPEPSRRGPNGVEIWNFGIATPIEVLHNMWGDCDSKCLLFAAILANYPRQSVVFLIGNDHMFAGVRNVPRRGDRFVEVQGVRYVLVELTDLWPLGRLPSDMWRGVKRNDYRIIRL